MNIKTIPVGLSSQTPVTIFDKTKPYMAGRVYQKNIGGTPVIGPPALGFINSIVDTGVLAQATRTTPNGRHFEILSIVTGVVTIALYTVDFTGQTLPNYVGKIQIRLPNAAATTHTLRGFEIYDGASSATVTGWQIYLGTVGTVLVNGGLFLAHNIALSDFVPTSPPLIEMAIASNSKAVYMCQDPGTIGVANTLTAMQGLAMDRATRRLYFNNNVLATTHMAVFDPSATPNVVIQTTTAATVNGSPTFALTGHGYANNDPVVLLTNVPTGFLQTTAVAVQNVYFARNVTANTFELSLTSGGVSVNAGSVTSGTTITRAFGQSVSQWLTIRTGTITGVVGTIVLTNSLKVVVPSRATDPTIPLALDGQTCLFWPTSSTFHLVKVSDIVNGATSLASMAAVNNTGTGTDFTAITTVNATYSPQAGRIIYTSNVSQFYVKRWLNNVIDLEFGGMSTNYIETSGILPTVFAGVTVNNLETENGWLYLALGGIGQRGVLYMDFQSDASIGTAFVTSPIIDTSDVQAAVLIATIEKLFDETAPMVFSYKTKSLATDTAFDDPTTGFTVIPTGADASSYAFNNFTVFKVAFNIALDSTNYPAQIYDLYLAYLSKSENSDYWDIVNDGTTQGATSPCDTVFRLKKAFVGSVPTLYQRDYDLTTKVLVSTVVSNVTPTAFNYSADEGGTWNALGTIPNTVGTYVRVRRPLPGGTKAYPSMKES